MKLFLHPLSGNSRRVNLVATHLGLPLERVVVDLPKGEQRSEAHLTRNPNGPVPVLDDDGLVLWESRAIMTCLADKTPGQALHPADVRERAGARRLEAHRDAAVTDRVLSGRAAPPAGGGELRNSPDANFAPR